MGDATKTDIVELNKAIVELQISRARHDERLCQMQESVTAIWKKIDQFSDTLAAHGKIIFALQAFGVLLNIAIPLIFKYISR